MVASALGLPVRRELGSTEQNLTEARWATVTVTSRAAREAPGPGPGPGADSGGLGPQ